jgi:DNA-binding transcriptional regulator YiaG
MNYESDILKTIHENALENYRLGLISEADMRDYDEACLPQETQQDNTAHETIEIEHPDLVTA